MSALGTALELAVALTSKSARSTMVRAIRSETHFSFANCPCCGFEGKFDSVGAPVRIGAMCPKCKSLERHRLFVLVHERGDVRFAGQDVLHFAPEKMNGDIIKADNPTSYKSADIQPGRGDLVLNIEQIALPDASVDTVVAFHVLEHVNDKKAMAELFRIVRPGGCLVTMVPLVDGWAETYENPAVISGADQLRHFGLVSHVRYYGADFRDRLEDVGFHVTEFGADGLDSVKFNLQRGEKVFVARKP